MTTATTGKLFGKYHVERGEADYGPQTVTGEYHLHGTRGAHYVTIRRRTNDRVTFMNVNRPLSGPVAIEGNYHLATDLLERHTA